MKTSRLTIRTATLLLLTVMLGAHCAAKSVASAEKTRADYISKIVQQTVTPPADLPTGSLWLPDGVMTDLPSDYKAHRLNDLVTIVVVQQTTASVTGNVNTERDFDTNSGITGLAGHISTSGVNNILTATSASKLKGAGSADASSAMKTSLSGQVIAVLPNGNLVVEAQRDVAINNQKETMIVRGVLRPGDVSPGNTAPSTALANLEVELKGKGVISDATRPPNRLMRALLWIIGF